MRAVAIWRKRGEGATTLKVGADFCRDSNRIALAQGGLHGRLMNHRGWKWVWIASAAALLAVGGCRKKSTESAQPKPASPESVALHAMADHARLDAMRWPNFADLKKPVEDFYGAHGFEPVWLKGNKPTAQARQMMAAFAACGTDGLDPEDYDSAPSDAARDSAPSDAARDRRAGWRGWSDSHGAGSRGVRHGDDRRGDAVSER